MSNSIEFEGELKLRLTAAASANQLTKIPSPSYVGMFAGANKPKPFQRKRPNLSHLPAGKLPSLNDMRNSALDLHRGSYRPCPQGESRRMEIALQHIYEGYNTFQLLNVRGSPEFSNAYRGSESVLLITDEALIYKPRGHHTDFKLEINYDDVNDWNVVDNDNYRSGDSGIEVIFADGAETVFFGFQHVRDVKHTLEYFWNNHKVANGQANQVKLGSTHGRPIVSAQSLSGEVPPPESPVGQVDVVDQDGILVRPGGKIAPRRQSIAAGVIATKEPKVVPSENREVKKHWHKVVMHQGWLLKQGGVGVGSAKSWIKRYFVLYKTSQGHFLVYYSDFTECPMYTSEKNHRNIVDLAKATFIRPGSNKQDNPDTPPYSFDIVTTEREWTLCAESQENVHRWLKLITRAVDEDVAILPDEELVFKVKPKLDPLQILPATDYTTSLKVSAYGVSVTAPDTNSKDNAEKEHYFWVYTDFYKWSLMCPDGKFALLVNVFADSSFSRRYEYVFRTKEANRLATAIEYFIEKFMSVMHIRMETMEGAFDQVADDHNEANGGHGADKGLHVIPAGEENHNNQYGNDIDLLGMEVESSSSPMAAKSINHANGLKAASGDRGDVFGNKNPFEEDNHSRHVTPSQSTPPRPTQSAALDLLDMYDAPPAPPAPPAAPAPSSTANLFNDDPFGSGDPFGAPFGSSPAPAAGGPKIAPPLTPQQIDQHNRWWFAALAANGGPIYDDGTIQILSKVEVRGSQCRLSLQYSNQSPAAASDFKAEIVDAAGLLRVEAAPVANNIGGLGKETQVIMLECMKPAAPGPQLKIEYNDSFNGRRNNTINLPIVVTTFNEGLTLTAEDFMNRWQLLTNPGQEIQQVFRPSTPIVVNQIHASLTSVSSLPVFCLLSC